GPDPIHFMGTFVPGKANFLLYPALRLRYFGQIPAQYFGFHPITACMYNSFGTVKESTSTGLVGVFSTRPVGRQIGFYAPVIPVHLYFGQFNPALSSPLREGHLYGLCRWGTVLQ